MTIEEARHILSVGANLPQLVDALTVITTSSNATLDDFLLGLQHPGFIAEQAAFELYSRTDRDLPCDLTQISINPDEWRDWLVNHAPPRSTPARTR